MSSIISRLAIILTIGIQILSYGCSDARKNVTPFNPETGKHPADWIADHGAAYLSDTIQCATCHGSDLKGGISGVSCFSASFNGMSCHGHPAGWNDPTSHGASAKSAPDPSLRRGFQICGHCHGSDFSGGPFNKSCFTCHGVSAPHSPAPWRGSVRTHTTTNQGNAPVCALCHTNGTNSPIQPSPFDPAAAPGCFNNTLCHGGNVSGGCSGCHDSPPQTGTHLVHFNSAPTNTLTYGDTTINSTVDAYRFGCGNCHPLDSSKHMNGTVDIELYKSTAPAGSIKAKNSITASYTPGAAVTTYTIHAGNSVSYSNGTCYGVYCHSGKAVSSGPVGTPLIGSNGLPIVDANGNLTYAPYTVTISRLYKTTPAWGTNSTGTNSTFGACTECHQFPLTTSYPSVEAGVGDSHQWIDSDGYGSLHAFNMGFNPLGCRTCHASTVTQPNTWSRNSSDVTTYNPVPLADRKYHVTGSPVVKFDTVNPITAYPSTYNLSSAVYDPGTKTCSNVSCHLSQTTVKWGSPYRYNDANECNVCHRN